MRFLQCLMEPSTASWSSGKEEKVPRLRHWKEMTPPNISSMFNREQAVGVKCIATRGYAAS